MRTSSKDVVEPTQEKFGVYTDKMRQIWVDQKITEEYIALRGGAKKPKLIYRTGLRSLWYQLIMWGLNEK